MKQLQISVALCNSLPCKLLLFTWGHGYIIKSQAYSIWSSQVLMERQQEVLMWEAFAACVRTIRAGKPPRREWPQQSLLTQRVLCAIAESAASDCRIVNL